MPLKNFLLTLHIIGAIVAFGPVFVMPQIGAMAAKEGAPVPWLIRLQNDISFRHFTLAGDIIMPSTGAAMIVLYGKTLPYLNPFNSQGRWLGAAIIVFIAAFLVGDFVMLPKGKRLQELADSGQYGPEFGSIVGSLQKLGMLQTVFLLTIIVLMVTKPGSGFIHS